jgi:hypothetical protein
MKDLMEMTPDQQVCYERGKLMGCRLAMSDVEEQYLARVSRFVTMVPTIATLISQLVSIVPPAECPPEN